MVKFEWFSTRCPEDGWCMYQVKCRQFRKDIQIHTHRPPYGIICSFLEQALDAEKCEEPARVRRIRHVLEVSKLVSRDSVRTVQVVKSVDNSFQTTLVCVRWCLCGMSYCKKTAIIETPTDTYDEYWLTELSFPTYQVTGRLCGTPSWLRTCKGLTLHRNRT